METMKKHSQKKYGQMLIVFMLIVGLLLPQGLVQADTTQPVSLKIENSKLVEVDFSIYRVASFDANGVLQPVDSFLKYSISWKLDKAKSWDDLAQTLAGYVKKDNIASTDNGTTDKNGVLRFPAKISSLPTGTYLVMGKDKKIGDKKYTFKPFLVTLPANDKDGKVIYDVVVNPKYKTRTENTGSSDVQRRVIKVWDDKGNEKKRPVSIEVELLKDDKVYDTVTLNKDNDWRHTWNSLSSTSEWRVVEKKVPENYRVRVTEESTTFYVKNTYTPPTPPETPPDKPKTPPSGGKIPQTGILWWPIQLMIVGGILLFSIGWFRRKTSEGTDENS